MGKPKIEEFMVFLDRNHEMGVIIKNKVCDCWKKCYKSGGGQIFRESINDDIYNSIIKLYKAEKIEDVVYYALSFMSKGEFLNRYECVYSKIKT